MIIVRIELWSAVTGRITELARMQIANRGTGSQSRGDYIGETYTGRSTADLDRKRVSKTARVDNYPRQALHVWNLVHRMLTEMGYTR